MRKILVSETLDQIKVAVVDNSKLTNFFIDSLSLQASIRGNIYKAKKNLNAKGIEASFVEIENKKSAFLSSFHPLKADFKSEENDSYKVENKNFILVQCVSDYDPRKAPKVSDFVALPSKYCVIIGKPRFFGISKKINSDEERNRLKSIKKSTTRSIGIILRTASQNQKIKDIKEDIRKTKLRWKEIISDFNKNDECSLLHQENNIIESTYRELVNNDTKEIQVNSRKLYNYFKKQTFNSKSKKIKTEVTLVSNKKDLFKANNLEKEISKIFHKKVNLKNGSFLLIEEKEGLTVIDVNSGRSLNNKKENNLSINISAAKEIGHQIVLRNLSGIILIDFIDLQVSQEKKKLHKILKDSLKNDKAKHTILPMSKFGVIEMTRQKIGNRTSSLVSESCSICYGSGVVTRKDIISYDLIREIISLEKGNKKKKIVVEIQENLLDTFNEIINKNRNNNSIKQLKITTTPKKMDKFYKII